MTSLDSVHPMEINSFRRRVSSKDKIYSINALMRKVIHMYYGQICREKIQGTVQSRTLLTCLSHVILGFRVLAVAIVTTVVTEIRITA